MILEVDLYTGSPAGLGILECELPRNGAADELVLPDWAADAKEVTFDARYKNRNLAVSGIPSG